MDHSIYLLTCFLVYLYYSSATDITQMLYLTEGTVRNYTSEIFAKLGGSDRTQAAVVALRYGLVDLHDLDL